MIMLNYDLLSSVMIYHTHNDVVLFCYIRLDVAKFPSLCWLTTVFLPGVVNDPDAVLQKTDALGRVLRLCVAWSNEADDCWKLG